MNVLFEKCDAKTNDNNNNNENENAKSDASIRRCPNDYCSSFFGTNLDVQTVRG